VSQEGKPRIINILEQARELTGFKREETDLGEAEPSSDKLPKPKSKENTQKPPKTLETNSLDEDETTLLQAWRADKWIINWLSLEPALSGIDLRPYFYFSRDNIVINVNTVRRMSPESQKILAEFLGESEVVRRAAIDRSVALNQVDVNSLFSSLADRFRNNDDVRIKESILKLMFDFVEKRKEAISQIIIFLKTIPETMIPIVAVVRLGTLTTGREEEKAADALLQVWSTNKINSFLAKAAADAIKRKSDKK